MRIEAELTGAIRLPEYLIESIAAKTIKKTSFEFVEYLKKSRFDRLFESRTETTRKSIGAYRSKGKNPAYLIKAGIGIKGSLNYLAGLYRGYAVSRSGKKFMYKEPRDLIESGWNEWQGEQKLNQIGEDIMSKLLETV